MELDGTEQTIVFYDGGFFGYGPEGDFAQWSLAHIAPIAITIVLIVITWKQRGRLRSWRHEEIARFIYCLIGFLSLMGYYWRLLYVGTGPDISNTLMDRLPLQVCEWTLFIAMFMMLKKSPLLFDMTFFLTMSFSLVPLILPATITHTGPTYFLYYQFWEVHLLPIYGMFYMMFVHGLQPHPRGIIAVLVMLAVLAVPALLLNQAFDAANYLYLKPEQYSMLAFLPDSLPVLIVLYLCIASALLGIDWLVWKLVTRRGGKAREKD